MGFFADDELSGLRINRTILHVVGHDHDFEPQEELEGQGHHAFFLARVRDAATVPLHTFAKLSPTKQLLQQIAAGDMDFQAGGQELARRFIGAHRGNSSAGAFFFLDLTANERTSFFCLLKYDYQPAVELSEDDGKPTLREIVQAFIREKRALQKCCIVRVSDGVVQEEVSAIDRMGKAPDLVDYFQSYLDVHRHRDEAELSGRLNEAIRQALQSCKDVVPSLAIGTAIKEAKANLAAREQVDGDAIKEAVRIGAGAPADEETIKAVDNRTDRALRRCKLEGATFKPSQDFFRRRVTRTVETAEGVALKYPIDLEGTKVRREQLPEGGWRIVVETEADFDKDGTLPDNAR